MKTVGILLNTLQAILETFHRGILERKQFNILLNMIHAILETSLNTENQFY